ncbi:hypothetical protein BDD14_6613 [Edaphobacter modestus]|uniref:Uncharacterized protein n=1 Tax=Edaphobacter modestus TaxID=388466 RepID=A0A4Q7XZ03_9BACT|nr:hypothetical protein BDD14_6613 [Edaphobacter modestus]
MRDLGHNGDVNMLTTTSIFETLGTKRFDSYKSLLSNVASFWEMHAGRLPSEIGPRDVVAKAVSLHLLKKNADGSIVIISPKRMRKSGHGSARKRTSAGRAAV